MDASAKSQGLQSYQVVLYSRALHPEFFQLRARRVVRHDGYEFEAWLMGGAHLLRFEHGPVCACELLTDQESALPEHGVVTAFLCAGERDFDHAFLNGRVNYITTVQTETLSENLYLATHDELAGFAREVDGVSHAWSDEAGPCLSMLDIQRMNREIHVQAYHLIAREGAVIRTQTIFEAR